MSSSLLELSTADLAEMCVQSLLQGSLLDEYVTAREQSVLVHFEVEVVDPHSDLRMERMERRFRLRLTEVASVIVPLSAIA